MATVDIFKIAIKEKYRWFYKGVISTEDLFDLSLEALDGIYKNLMKQKRNESEESLLSVSKEDKELNIKIEIIKAIVADKLTEKEKARRSAERKAQNQRILEIMADKKDAALKEKTIEELQAMIINDEEDE